MTVRRTFCWVTLGLLAAALSAPGQALLTVEEAVARAIAGHPLLTAGERQIAVSEGLRRQAGLAPNPSFTFQHENVRTAPEGIPYWTFSDTFAYVEQRFETAGKRRRRVESASVGVERAALEKELLAKQLAGRVKQAYWAAAGARRIYELLLEAARNFLLIVEYHEVRVREGAMAEADLLRIRLESERLNLAAKAAFLESERARISLFREMGVADIPAAVRFE
ncbi:MAG TPA: TolC family protein, partial [Bryobacterales bacterium]|nr:TolC family protein [Bryobacterales bacterium]